MVSSFDCVQGWFGYVLAWMVTFDLFSGAVSNARYRIVARPLMLVSQSLKVKSGYIDQLKDLDLVGSRLLPAVFGLLDLYGGMAKAFKLEIWDVDEFYLDCELRHVPKPHL